LIRRETEIKRKKLGLSDKLTLLLNKQVIGQHKLATILGYYLLSARTNKQTKENETKDPKYRHTTQNPEKIKITS
jgi:hypothetical protein